MSFRKNHFDYEYIAIRMMLIFFKSVGLAPLSIRRSPEFKRSKKEVLQVSASIKFSSSPFGCVYNLCLITIQVLVLFLGMSDVNSIEYPYKSTLTTTIELTSCMFGNGVMFMIWLIFGFRQRTAARLLNRLLSMDGAAVLLNSSHFLESSGSFIIFLFATTSAIWTGVIFTNWLSYSHPISIYLMYFPGYIISTWILVHYTFTVKLIENRFKTVNRGLLDRSISSSADIPHGLFVNGVSENHPPGLKIATLRRAHINLCEIASEISDFYSLPILFTFANICFLLIYDTYYLVVPFVITLDYPATIIIVNSLFWLSSGILPIVTLASGVTNVGRETQKTAHIVRKLLTISDSRRDDSDELEQFLLELLHRKVEFSACGLFSLDCTIVYSIFSTVCTYLIILIQFQMGSSTND